MDTYRLTAARLATLANLVDVQPADERDVLRWLDRMGATPEPDPAMAAVEAAQTRLLVTVESIADDLDTVTSRECDRSWRRSRARWLRKHLRDLQGTTPPTPAQDAVVEVARNRVAETPFGTDATRGAADRAES